MFQGLLLCPMVLEAQIPVPDPAVILTPRAIVEEQMSQGRVRTALALPWASPGEFLNV